MSKIRKDIFKQDVKDYSINLLWINKKQIKEQNYIHPAKDKEELEKKMLNFCIEWAEVNKQAEIKFWYDSTLYNKKAIENTQMALSNLAKTKECNNISLHDIREIEFVNKNEVLFTQDIGVYFRIDYLKLVILAQELIVRDKDSAIYSDLGVETKGIYKSEHGNNVDITFNKEELFRQEFMNKLEKFGIITNTDCSGYMSENQFIQIVNNETAIDALRHVTNACLMRGIELLNASNQLQKYNMPYMYKIPFYSTIREVSKLYQGMKAQALKVNVGFIENGIKGEIWVKYDPKEHGYTPLGNWQANAKADLGYINVNFKINPDSPTYTCLEESIDLGFKDSECMSVRKCFVGMGNSHRDEIILPLEGHEKFEAYYWLEENRYEVEAIGEN